MLSPWKALKNATLLLLLASVPAAAVSSPPPPLPMPQEPSVQQAAGSIDSYVGQTVVAIHLKSIVEIPTDRFLSLVAQPVGQPLDKDKVQQGLEALYATGRFADIQLEADRDAKGGVTLTFVGKENYFIGLLVIERGPSPPNRRQLVNAAKLQVGELFAPEKVKAAIDRMQALLAENGYYKAAVAETQEVHADSQQVDLHFRVEAGALARIGSVTVEGTPGFNAAEIQDVTHLHPNNKVTAAGLTRALDKIRKKYQGQHRLEAQVTVSHTYHPDTNTLDYVLNVNRGPVIDIQVDGAKISKRRLKKLVPVYQENAADDDLLNEGLRNMRDYLQTKGYFDAQVSWKQESAPDGQHRVITYHVDQGKHHKLAEVALEGNKYFNRDLLRERMLMQPSGALLANGRYSESLQLHDREAIENVYRTNGFNQVVVTPRVEDNYQGHEGDMRVVYNINEGPQTRVAALHILGNLSVPESELTQQINTAPGEPYSEATVASDRDAIMNYYFNHGFPGAHVEATAASSSNNTEDVTYHVTEGERVYVDRVYLTGLHYTHGFVVDREFQLWDGDPLSQLRMLATQRNLYDLGIFNEVNMAVQNPDGVIDHKNLLVQFDEARRWTFDYGFGFEVETGSASQACPSSLIPQLRTQCLTRFAQLFSSGQATASPRVSLGITRINFRGRNQTLSFRGNFGRLEQRAAVSFEQPNWFNHDNLKLTLSTFYDNSRDVQTFTARRIEAAAEVQQTVSPITTLLYRFSYRRVEAIDNTLILSVEQIPILSEPVRVGIPSISYIRDKRDNPIDTHKGNYTTGDFGSAWSAFGSQANFNRVNVQNSTYQAFGRNRWVFARSTRIGVAVPFGGLVKDPNTGVMLQPYIPLPERFFAGGANSLRGFDLNGAGPRDLTFGTPTGGGGMFINNLELRTPPVHLPYIGDNLGFVIFEDAGNVFNDPADIPRSVIQVSQGHSSDCHSVTVAQALNQCGFNYLSHAIGGGIRYKTPIGPVRVDVGYSLNPPTFPRYSIPDVHTLPRINFSFSIGQTF